MRTYPADPLKRFTLYTDRARASCVNGYTSKAAQKDALDDINRAYDAARSLLHHKLLNMRDAKALTEEQFRPLYWGTPDCHVWKEKHARLFCAPEFAEDVARLNACAALRLIVKAATVDPARKPESKTRREEIERAAHAMTCQICGRGILAEGGLIAHHGYERPGTGWQTGSCYGARRIPYEAGHDALDALIPGAQERWEDLREHRASVAREVAPVVRHFEKRTGQYSRGREMVRTVAVEFTRETLPYAYHFARPAFDGISITNRGTVHGMGKERAAFDHCKLAYLAECDGNIAQAKDWLAYLTKRRDAWKLTSGYSPDGWIKL